MAEAESDLPSTNNNDNKKWQIVSLVLFGATIILSALLLTTNKNLLSQKSVTQAPSQTAPQQYPTPTPAGEKKSIVAISKVSKATGWIEYQNPSLNLVFSYPPTWQLTTTQSPYGSFRIELLSPNRLRLRFGTGIAGVGGGCDPDKNASYDPVTIFGKSLYLIYNQDFEKKEVTHAFVEEEKIACPNIAFFDIKEVGTDIPYIHESDHEGFEEISIYYESTNKKAVNNNESYESIPKNSIAEFKSADVETAKQILSTFTTLSN